MEGAALLSLRLIRLISTTEVRSTLALSPLSFVVNYPQNAMLVKVLLHSFDTFFVLNASVHQALFLLVLLPAPLHLKKEVKLQLRR